MREDPFGDDEVLMGLIGEALREARDVPPWMIETGYAAYAWHNIDTELATLTYDSAAAGVLVSARSQQAPLRALTFSCASLTIELELAPDALLGQLIQPGPTELTVSFQDRQTRTLPVDEVGCFVIQPLPDRPFRIQVLGEFGEVSTDWIHV